MGDFFHGWRRKAGCVTLVLALAALGVWARSVTIADIVVVIVPAAGMTYSVHSHGGTTDMHLMRGDPADALHWWFSSPMVNYPHLIGANQTHLQIRRCGDVIYLLSIPHWLIVLTLTLPSAFLILWKPRTRNPPCGK